jgi:hypothetical protein
MKAVNFHHIPKVVIEEELGYCPWMSDRDRNYLELCENLLRIAREEQANIRYWQAQLIRVEIAQKDNQSKRLKRFIDLGEEWSGNV